MNELKHKDIWNGEYRGVKFEIVNWRLGGDVLGSHPCWNYYLFLPIEQIPEEYHKYFVLEGKYERMSPDGRAWLNYNYTGTSYISDLEWHGGITFYEKALDGEGKLIGVKLGCDYVHYFDEQDGYPYNVDYVYMETKQSIDKLHLLIPNMKVRCQWDGKYYDKSDCEEVKYGWMAKKNHDKYYEVRATK
ncbi:MAG: hypothetical protein PHY18_06615 [Dehalococcoidales bacterium]|nr:hypothetical protein [Dehalococcoidales bacterium]